MGVSFLLRFSALLSKQDIFNANCTCNILRGVRENLLDSTAQSPC